MPLVALSDEANGSCKYTVSVNGARMMLQPLLGSSTSTTTKPFPFMRLPTELREVIYDMVMTFPKSGISLPPHRGGRPLEVFSRDHKTETCIQQPTRMYLMLEANPMEYYLDILLVNRQIHQEALPIFYKRNKFLFSDQAIMESRLQVLAVERRNHIEHISFAWNRTSKTQAERCFKRLRAMPYLRHLDIHINEKQWLEAVQGSKPFDNSKIHGFNALKAIRGLETVNFYGDCDNVERALANVLTQAKSEKQKQKIGKKRKAPKEVEDHKELEKQQEGSRKTRSTTRASIKKASKSDQELRSTVEDHMVRFANANICIEGEMHILAGRSRGTTAGSVSDLS
ncbi:hypothetical protein CLAFUW4_13704 [Fulvia fulva]|uniref:DUF7730 domain-containing protein n=1 Tax=Passalora fulva TaxID=5499 RepID=A0A9Q8PL85_PASFU|nr:uncharacterized protein CLAFUR5_13554 [Fulvia fulva]KAK4610097.1 hypothetical protein CLAFUR4_13707 [Fulvia fulva]KAK4611075.1 hypothetical protein CLAFUR0_13711 [Fulvia fulva]UJO24457.1 hypothetical protein CLAFUR5_13554 [Fulvia fulva]WPV21813.1 hypothetical protein CLAFUW4_13704 [Fulvia fulva]WPV36853.1 hypothetical protein CLAFUW7_13712 [Fulvia fulva]